MAETKDEAASQNKTSVASENQSRAITRAATDFDSGAYCDFNTSIAQTTAGKDILFCIFNAAGTSLLALEGQQNFELSVETETTDVQTKDTRGGWGSSIAGVKTWTVTVEGLVAQGAAASNEVLKSLRDGTPLCMKVVEEHATGDGTFDYVPLYGGLVIATTYTDTSNVDDNRTFSVEFGGQGELTIAAIADPAVVALMVADPENRQ